MTRVSAEQLLQASAYGLLILWVSLSFSPALVEISFVFSLVTWIAAKVKKGTLLLSPLPKGVMFPLMVYVLLCIF